MPPKQPEGQSQLFPEPEHPSGRPYKDDEQWINSVRDSARFNPNYEEDVRRLHGTGIPVDPTGIKRRIDVLDTQETTTKETDNTKKRLPLASPNDPLRGESEADVHPPDYFGEADLPTAEETQLGKQGIAQAKEILDQSRPE